MLFSVHASTGGEVTPKSVFTTLSFVLLLSRTTVFFFVNAILTLLDGQVALTRVQVFANICVPLMYVCIPTFKPFLVHLMYVCNFGL